MRRSRELQGIVEFGEEDLNESSGEDDQQKSKLNMNDLTCKPSKHRKKYISSGQTKNVGNSEDERKKDMLKLDK